jgi:hypothetical protein
VPPVGSDGDDSDNDSTWRMLIVPPSPSLDPTPLPAPGPAVDPGAVGTVSVPDIRDYHLINAELAQRLDAGYRRVRLLGAEGQRLLVSRLRGAWEAVVEVEGHAGPELAAELDAPGLTVVCHGSAADGAARGLKSGFVLVIGDVGAAVGYALRGGTVVVAGQAGPRAGLNQQGGDLVLLGPAGPLAGERQSGGRLFAVGPTVGPHLGRGCRGGRLIEPRSHEQVLSGLDPDDASDLGRWLERASPWIGPRV